jgi:hypothetical protein
MTPQEFITRVIDLYYNARHPLLRHEKLARGESRSVASETEDLLAYYLAMRVPSIDRIFINQPLMRPGHPRLKPDLVICARSQIRALIDVKMDLGYKRDKFASTLATTDAQMEQIRGQAFSLLRKGQDTRERVSLPLAASAKYLFAIVSDQNINAQLMNTFEVIASCLTRIRLHILTRKCHPNAPILRDQVNARMVICTEAFEQLESEVSQLLAEQ